MLVSPFTVPAETVDNIRTITRRDRLHTKNQPGLDASLEAYTSAVQTAAESRSWSERLGSWPVYAAAAGSALALGTSAAASIIYSGIQNFTVSVTAGYPGARSTSDYFTVGPNFAYPYLRAFHYYSGGYRLGGVGIRQSCACGTEFFGLPFNPDVENYPLKNLAFGQLISDGLATGPGSTQLNSMGFLAFRCEASTPASCSGGPALFESNPWGKSGATGFAGFKTAGGNFGWIRLLWNASNGFPNSITAVDWAIEDSGAGILAGATSAAAVPEPGTLSMALLAAGAAGIAAWRKRRAAAAKG